MKQPVRSLLVEHQDRFNILLTIFDFQTKQIECRSTSADLYCLSEDPLCLDVIFGSYGIVDNCVRMTVILSTDELESATRVWGDRGRQNEGLP